jgi:hypothetical protein
MVKALRFVNVFSMGIETGTAVFALRAVLPALQRWSDAQSSEAQREILVHGAYSYILVTHAVARVSAAFLLLREQGASRLSKLCTSAGLVVGLGVTILTQLRLFPINRILTDTPPGTVPDDYPRLREQWEQAHTLRTAMDLFTFACFLIGAISSRASRRP